MAVSNEVCALPSIPILTQSPQIQHRHPSSCLQGPGMHSQMIEAVGRLLLRLVLLLTYSDMESAIDKKFCTGCVLLRASLTESGCGAGGPAVCVYCITCRPCIERKERKAVRIAGFTRAATVNQIVGKAEATHECWPSRYYS